MQRIWNTADLMFFARHAGGDFSWIDSAGRRHIIKVAKFIAYFPLAPLAFS